MRQTGVSVNEQPQVELQVQVQDQMYGSRQATVKEYVPLMLLGTLSSEGATPGHGRGRQGHRDLGPSDRPGRLGGTAGLTT
jgi:hypothetical protein